MLIKIPDEARRIIYALESNGFEAYVVGGCVRDRLLGFEPDDWDICTSALPDDIKKCFEGENLIDTGLKHGTVTLMRGNKPFEITTYRVDGKYRDNRRPESVKFVDVLKRDLARRDFTINAMAYHPERGLVDYYTGRQDLAEGKIKCVGNPNKRFGEDALRIVRALRFASTLGFSVEDGTAQAALTHRGLLRNIAAERLNVEFNKLLLGDGAVDIISVHLPIIFEIIPELETLKGLAPTDANHCHDMLTHALMRVNASPKDLVIRLTLLLHDIGAAVSPTDERADSLFAYSQIGSEMAEKLLTRLKYDNDTINTVTQLILYHNTELLADKPQIKRLLNVMGEKKFRLLLEVKRADALAGVSADALARSEVCHRETLDELDAIATLTDEIINNKECFSLKDLAVSGKDLIAADIPQGVRIGKTLNKLLQMVINEETCNEKERLLEIALNEQGVQYE